MNARDEAREALIGALNMAVGIDLKEPGAVIVDALDAYIVAGFAAQRTRLRPLPLAALAAQPEPVARETERLASLLGEIAACGVEHHDRRDGYACVQIDSDLWDEVKEFAPVPGASLRRRTVPAAPDPRGEAKPGQEHDFIEDSETGIAVCMRCGVTDEEDASQEPCPKRLPAPKPAPETCQQCEGSGVVWPAPETGADELRGEDAETLLTPARAALLRQHVLAALEEYWEQDGEAIAADMAHFDALAARLRSAPRDEGSRCTHCGEGAGAHRCPHGGRYFDALPPAPTQREDEGRAEATP